MRRKRVSRTAGDWKKIIEAWAATGMSQRDFCAKHGIGLSSFYQRRARLNKEARRKSDGDAFVAIGPLELPTSSPAAVVRWPDGAKIELSRMPDPEWVRRVLGS